MDEGILFQEISEKEYNLLYTYSFTSMTVNILIEFQVEIFHENHTSVSSKI